jgi:N-acetylneuraminic acid mutarotase
MRVSLIPAILGITLAAACTTSDNTTPVTVTGYSVVIKTAPPASATVLTAIPIAFTVTEHESDGTARPAGGKTFTIAITAGNGTVNGGESATLTTASDGSAAATWMLGSAPSTQSVRGSISPDEFADMSVIATAGPAVQLVVTTQPASLAVSLFGLTRQPVVQLEDAAGNAVALAGVPVNVSIATGTGSIIGTVIATSDAAGRATFTDLALNAIAGTVTLSFVAILSGHLTNVSSAAIVVRTPWVTRASMSQPRSDLGSGVVNGILYVVGGSTNGLINGATGAVEAYDPATDAWTTKASMSTPRSGLAAGVVNGILYAVGGINGNIVLATVEAFDPVANSWTTRASLPSPRYGLSVAAVNGILYAVGGSTNGLTNSATGAVEAYDPATDAWTTKASMPTPRSGLAAGVVNGILYAVGGRANLSGVSAVEAYDPATDAWTTKASMPTPRSGLAAGVVNGILYAVGGTGPPNGLALVTVEAYNPATDTWTTPLSAVAPRSRLTVGAVNGVLYAVGGFNEGFGVLGTTESFAP